MKRRKFKKPEWRLWLPIAGAIAVILIYFLGAYRFYTGMKSRELKNAWKKLEEMDLGSLEEEDEEILHGFEINKLEFLITDGDFRVVYTTRKSDTETQVEQYIRKNLDSYMEQPEVSMRQGNANRILRMRGIISGHGERFYVYIRRDIRAVGEIIRYAGMYFTAGILLVMLLGIPLYLQYAGKKQSEEEPVFADAGNQTMEQVRKEFIANVSHELKTPLAVISGQVEMLQSMGDKIDRDYYFASIREEIDKMSELVSDLLEITIVEHRMDEMEMSPVNLSEMMEYLILKYDALFCRNRIHLKTGIAEKVQVYGNSMYLEQAVNNYIMNAFQHTAQGKRMEIRLETEDHFARIGVYNEGAGIAPEVMEHIWEGFYQNEKAKQKKELKVSNAGLGLYLVKKIVVQHQGECGAENREDGVEFWIRIPLLDGKKGEQDERKSDSENLRNGL